MKAEFNTPWIVQRADPYIYRHTDGIYYFTASVPAYDRIILRRAASLEEIRDAEEKTIWNKHETGPMSCNIWAPELHFINGGWYIYYAGGEKDDMFRIRPYVLKCTGSNPFEDSWEEMGPMRAAEKDEFSFTSFSLDGTTFESKGNRYYIWAEKVGTGKQISNLYIAGMKTPDRLETQQVLLSTPDYEWERKGFWVNEGPAVLIRNKKVILTYSASDTGANYCMGMLIANEDDDLLDPGSWHKRSLPVLQSDPAKGIFGPGHNSFTVDEDGRDILVYHARTVSEIEGDPLYDPNRHTMLMQIKWDENGEPVFRF
ncbi:MAG: family 43 glycosylhydrolase [Lachnospiraceae bacterium]|nr:family 43 glycosylhydrolase [Lachnospiraceae bacterium]